MSTETTALIVPVLHNFEGFTKLMQSVDTAIYPIIIPNWNDNVGVSAAWNIGLEHCIEHGIENAVVSNDDIVFENGTLEKIVAGLAFADLVTAYNNRDENHPSIEAYTEHPDFACFAVQPKSFVHTFGYFDENFSPAYFEDNDMHYRMKVHGGKAVRRLDAPMFHAGSVTQNWGGVQVVTSPMFEMNREYYIQKWGGQPGDEQYRSPFNDPNKTIKDW